jgi:hypothetical protein
LWPAWRADREEVGFDQVGGEAGLGETEPSFLDRGAVELGTVNLISRTRRGAPESAQPAPGCFEEDPIT